MSYPTRHRLQDLSNRRVRAYELLDAEGHIREFQSVIVRMHSIARRMESPELDDGEVSIGSSAVQRDVFAMLKALADQHWRVIDRYLPKQQVEQNKDGEEEQKRGSLDALHAILANLTPRKVDPSLATVSDQVSPVTSTNNSTEGQQ